MGMPNNVKRFPRGYSGGQVLPTPRHEIRTGDEEISKLWAEYTSPLNRSTQWAFRKRVVRAAQRLLVGRPNWFVTQDVNPLVLEYNYQFIIDTLRFIATGRRRISIHAWPELVSNYPEDERVDVSTRHDIADAFIKQGLSNSVNELIAKWCSQPKGFDDMMCTLNILFGDQFVKMTDAH